MRNFTATVKESGSGQPRVVIEPDEDIGTGDGVITLLFEEGTAIEKAEQVARTLNKSVQIIRIVE